MKINYSADADNEVVGLVARDMPLDEGKKRKLYAILSSNLYNNRPMSMIRELASNARDSHLMAGCPDAPIEFTAPTYEDMRFSIRDHGVGLTADEAYSTILAYLGSAKDESDDYIGGYGLGSKSPFAFAETYEVHCYKDHHYWSFSCYRDSSGMPQVALLEHGDTVEPSGVRITVPVRVDQLHRLRTELQTYLENTDYAVRVTNPAPDFQFTPRTVVADIRLDDYRYTLVSGKRGVSVIYGGFVYPIDDLTSWNDDSLKIREAWGKLLTQYGVMIHVPVGGCDFPPSRESLAGTERTHVYILTALHHLQQYLDHHARDHYLQVIKPCVGAHPQSIDDLTTLQAELQQLSPDPDNLFARLDWDTFTRCGLMSTGGWLDKPINEDWHTVSVPILKATSSDLQKVARQISWRTTRKTWRDYAVLGAVPMTLNLALTTDVAKQVTVAWAARMPRSKQIGTHTGCAHMRYIVVRAPTAEAARAIMTEMGMGQLPVVELGDHSLPFVLRDLESVRRTQRVVQPAPDSIYDFASRESKGSYSPHCQYVIVPSSHWDDYTDCRSAYDHVLRIYGGVTAVARVSDSYYRRYHKLPNMIDFTDPRLWQRVQSSKLLYDLARHNHAELLNSYAEVIQGATSNRHLQRLLMAGLGLGMTSTSTTKVKLTDGARVPLLVQFCRARGWDIDARSYWASPCLHSPDQLGDILAELRANSPIVDAINWDRYYRLPRPLRLTIRAEAARAIQEIVP